MNSSFFCSDSLKTPCSFTCKCCHQHFGSQNLFKEHSCCNSVHSSKVSSNCCSKDRRIHEISTNIHCDNHCCNHHVRNHAKVGPNFLCSGSPLVDTCMAQISNPDLYKCSDHICKWSDCSPQHVGLEKTINADGTSISKICCRSQGCVRARLCMNSKSSVFNKQGASARKINHKSSVSCCHGSPRNLVECCNHSVEETCHASSSSSGKRKCFPGYKSFTYGSSSKKTTLKKSSRETSCESDYETDESRESISFISQKKVVSEENKISCSTQDDDDDNFNKTFIHSLSKDRFCCPRFQTNKQLPSICGFSNGMSGDRSSNCENINLSTWPEDEDSRLTLTIQMRKKQLEERAEQLRRKEEIVKIKEQEARQRTLQALEKQEKAITEKEAALKYREVIHQHHLLVLNEIEEDTRKIGDSKKIKDDKISLNSGPSSSKLKSSEMSKKSDMYNCNDKVSLDSEPNLQPTKILRTYSRQGRPRTGLDQSRLNSPYPCKIQENLMVDKNSGQDQVDRFSEKTIFNNGATVTITAFPPPDRPKRPYSALPSYSSEATKAFMKGYHPYSSKYVEKQTILDDKSLFRPIAMKPKNSNQQSVSTSEQGKIIQKTPTMELTPLASAANEPIFKLQHRNVETNSSSDISSCINQDNVSPIPSESSASVTITDTTICSQAKISPPAHIIPVLSSLNVGGIVPSASVISKLPGNSVQLLVSSNSLQPYPLLIDSNSSLCGESSNIEVKTSSLSYPPTFQPVVFASKSSCNLGKDNKIVYANNASTITCVSNLNQDEINPVMVEKSNDYESILHYKKPDFYSENNNSIDEQKIVNYEKYVQEVESEQRNSQNSIFSVIKFQLQPMIHLVLKRICFS